MSGVSVWLCGGYMCVGCVCVGCVCLVGLCGVIMGIVLWYVCGVCMACVCSVYGECVRGGCV